MKFNLYKKDPNGYRFIASVQENIEDDEVYATYKDGTSRAYRLGAFYDYYNENNFAFVEKQGENIN